MNFDSAKRFGCRGRAPYGLSNRVTYTVTALCGGGSPQAELMAPWGWKIHRYSVRGGQYTRGTPVGCAISFSFEVRAGARFSRHFNEITVTKPYGSCARLYDEML